MTTWLLVAHPTAWARGGHRRHPAGVSRGPLRWRTPKHLRALPRGHHEGRARHPKLPLGPLVHAVPCCRYRHRRATGDPSSATAPVSARAAEHIPYPEGPRV